MLKTARQKPSKSDRPFLKPNEILNELENICVRTAHGRKLLNYYSI